MNTLSELCITLSSSDLNEEQLYAFFKLIGQNSPNSQLNHTLDILVRIAPTFERYKEMLPNIADMFDLFLKANVVRDRLASQKYEWQLPSDSILKRKSINLEDLKLDEVNEYVADKVVFTYLIYGLTHSTPSLSKISSKVKLDGFISSIYTVLMTQSSPKSFTLLKKDNFSDWLSELIEFADDRKVTDSREVLIEFWTLLNTINQPLELQQVLNAENFSVPINQTKKILDKSGMALDERQRLNNHIDSLHPNELERLKNQLLKDSRVDHEDAMVSAYEVLIVTLALATGRSLDAVLKLQFFYSKSGKDSKKPKPEDYLEIQHVSKFNIIGWRRTSVTATSTLIFSDITSKFLKNFFVANKLDGHTVNDLLPFSFEPWPQRALRWVITTLEDKNDIKKKNVVKNKNDINYKIRNALTQGLYSQSANPAVISAMATSENNWGNTNSLLNYINSGSYVFHYYCQLAMSSFYSAHKLEYLKKRSINDSDGPYHDKSLSAFFKRKVEAAIRRTSIFELHNAISHYLLMLLVVATGHRQSRSPFYFVWDFNLTESLVFISDKATVGSEARYVPIPTWLVELIQGYQRYLSKLSINFKYSYPELSQHIVSILQGDRCNRDAGFFFSLDQNFNPHVISTGSLEDYYKQNSSKTTREFRRNIATYLVEFGLSGMQVEAFLGHNTQQHIFGASSAWSIKGWADQIRSAQQEYLVSGGWYPNDTVLKFFDQYKTIEIVKFKPNFQESTYSYEARALSRRIALREASSIIRVLIPTHWNYGGESINDDDIREILLGAQARTDDEEVKVKIRTVLSKVVARLRNKNRVSSALINLVRYQPSPIKISSARYVKIAQELRLRIVEQFQHESKSSSRVDNAAKIGLSFVLFDAVLDTSYLDQLLTAVFQGKIQKTHKTLMIHVQMSSNDSLYEKTLFVSPFTSTLILAYLRDSEILDQQDDLAQGIKIPEKDEVTQQELQLKQIHKRIQNMLDLVYINKNDQLNLNKFIDVMSAWWQLRLPGFLYSIAIGQHQGPGADLKSYYAIFDQQPDLSNLPKAELNKINQRITQLHQHSATSDAKKAISLIERIFANVDGRGSNDVGEPKKNSSKNQRRRLRDEMAAVFEDESELSLIAVFQPIVRFYLLFIRRLLEHGGAKKKNLAYNTIKQYTSLTKQLINVFWDFDVDTEEPQFFSDKYQLLIASQRKENNLPGLLQQFHQVLIEEIDAPRVKIHGGEKVLTYTRCGLLTDYHFTQAWQVIKELSLDEITLQQLHLYLLLGFKFGLRRKEAFYLDIKDFVELNCLDIHVANNPRRSLKSSTSRRRVPNFLLSKKQERFIQEIIMQRFLVDDEIELKAFDANDTSEVTERRKEQYLFQQHLGDNDFQYPQRIETIIKELLKMMTANNEIVSHSMRHSFSTRLAHFSVMSPRKISVSEPIEKALGEVDTDKLFETFKDGFHAWPFWIDQVAMWLGHAGVDTLLNTYFHTSSIRLAEFAWFYANEIDLFKDDEIASLLGLTHSAVFKMRARLQGKAKELNDEKPLISNEALVQHYIEKEKKVDLLSELHQQPTKDPFKQDIKQSIKQHQNKKSKSHFWFVYERLLLLRLKAQTSFEDLQSFASEIHIDENRMSKLARAYEELLAETAWIDFEPDQSEYLSTFNRHFDGVLKSKDQRLEALKILQTFYEGSPENAIMLKSFCDLWVKTINPNKPWFVVRTKDEFESIYGLMLKLGVQATQFEFQRTIKFSISNLQKHLTIDTINSIPIVDERISRGNKDIVTSELGFRLKQEAGAKLADTRDTHRIVFVLCWILKAFYD